MERRLKDDMIKSLINEDKAGIDLIYNAYHKRIYAFAYAYLKLQDDALDIVHEVFMKLWEYRNKIEPDANIEALIFTITKNIIFSTFRKRATEKKYLDHLAAVSVNHYSTVGDDLEYESLKDGLDLIIQKLPAKRQEVFIKSRIEGLTNKEIAQKLNISEKTVEDHMTKALAFVRKNMEEMGLLAVMYFYLFL